MTSSSAPLALALAAWLQPALADATSEGGRNGDASRIYRRAERKVSASAQLVTQIRYCTSELGAGYFPDEEEHIAASLNQQYYHFP